MSPDEKLIYELRQAVLENLENEQFSVTQLSKIIGVSRSHLHRRLKKLRNQSISKFIREVRLQESMKLLLQGKATASEIAYKVGFNSPSYFHKCFHRYYGYTPNEAKRISHNQQAEADLYDDLQGDQLINRDIGPSIKYRFIAAATIIILIALSVFYLVHEKRSNYKLDYSIAVLPFKNLSIEEGNQYFADGLVEDLLNRLAMIEEFKVISRTSSDVFRDRDDKKITEIASELDVSYIVEGSVQKYEKQARITIQLIDAKNDKHLWTRSFDVEMEDILSLQSEIAIQVASELSSELTDKQTKSIQKDYTKNAKAFELYQLGRFYWGKRIQKEYSTAIYYFEQAIVEDSTYALAFAGLADTYFLMTWGFKDPDEIIEYRNRAEENALKALKLDDQLVEAHTVLATLNFFIDWDWPNAEKRFLLALELNPNYSTLHHRYSEHLSYTGRHEDARKHIDKAKELDPLSFIVRSVSSKLYLNRGAFEEALSEIKKAEEMNKESLRPTWYKLLINYKLGNEQEALVNLKKMEKSIGNQFYNEMIDSIYKINGLENLLRWKIRYSDSIFNTSEMHLSQSVVKGLEVHHYPYSHLYKAKLYTFLGDNEKAMDWLELAFSEGSRMPDVPYWYSSNDLYSFPRYQSLLNNMNLPWSPETSK